MPYLHERLHSWAGRHTGPVEAISLTPMLDGGEGPNEKARKPGGALALSPKSFRDAIRESLCPLSSATVHSVNKELVLCQANSPINYGYPEPLLFFFSGTIAYEYIIYRSPVKRCTNLLIDLNHLIHLILLFCFNHHVSLHSLPAQRLLHRPSARPNITNRTDPIRSRKWRQVPNF